mmetsp:Transcript_798/g.1549  ORF Transcript_798/g.1549 Transcript_798/m.1549 type:complete len:85 (-) Transcript_798:276-530(-)
MHMRCTWCAFCLRIKIDRINFMNEIKSNEIKTFECFVVWILKEKKIQFMFFLFIFLCYDYYYDYCICMGFLCFVCDFLTLFLIL